MSGFVFDAVRFLTLSLFAASWPSPTVLGADSSSPEISFALRKLSEANVEGPDVERTYFTIGAARVFIGIPKGCEARLEDGSLVLLMKNPNLDGEVRVSRSPFATDVDMVSNALTYRDADPNRAPKGATDPLPESPALNPYPYNGWKSIGFATNYSLYGKSMRRTVAYLNLDAGAQIVVTTVAAKDISEKVEKVARQFIASWWVKAE